MVTVVPVAAPLRTASRAAAWSTASARPKTGAAPVAMVREAISNSMRVGVVVVRVGVVTEDESAGGVGRESLGDAVAFQHQVTASAQPRVRDGDLPRGSDDFQLVAARVVERDVE